MIKLLFNTCYLLNFFLLTIFFNLSLNGQVSKLILDQNFVVKSSSDTDKIWMNLYNKQGAFSQILIGFIEGATNGIDRDYDGYRLFGSNPLAFYSICDEAKLAIQGREPRKELERIPLGIYWSVNNTISLKIAIDDLEGSLISSGVSIVLEDKLLHIEHNLKISEYEFTLNQQGSFDDRFDLIIKDEGVLSTDENYFDNQLKISYDDRHIFLETKDRSTIKFIQIYDYLGRNVLSLKPDNYKAELILNNLIKETVLIVNVLLVNNKKLSKKMIFK